jgi:hypothetical protein
VVAANRADPDLARLRVTGEGHARWVDGAAGFSPAQQEDLLAFLLLLP